MTTATLETPGSAGDFLRAGPDRLNHWIAAGPAQLAVSCVVAIVAGAGLFGGALGSWREPLQALYTGIKLPLVILLTTLGNGLLNAMLAPLLGLNVTLRQSLVVVLMSFAIASLILGALSPVALFVVWNTPPLTTATSRLSQEHGFLQLTLATFVALAGVLGNARLFPLLRDWAGSVTIAYKVLFAWLAVNLFLGSQICWLLRPFIWEPGAPVRFIGRDYLRGSFYETVFEAARRLIFP